MSQSGFVLAGGRSTRMGTDKALLPFRGATLAGYIASQVREAAGSATLIGDPARYAALGYPVVADAVPECGPLGGIVTALQMTQAQWNLIVACDMPRVSAAFLSRLLVAAEQAGAACFVPLGPSGRPEPLCAVYHRDCLPGLHRALKSNLLKMQIVLETLRPRYAPPGELEALANVNTPREWALAGAGQP